MEPEDIGDEDGVPAELVELHEVLEWEDAVSQEVPEEVEPDANDVA